MACVNFLPKSNPNISGYDIAGKSMPAMNVGGDYYDFLPLDDHRIAIGLGDVSGNGLAASLVMANLQATIRSQALSDSHPAQCLERANRLLFRSTDARTFVSIFYAILDTRNHTLCYANAGQDQPLLFSPGKEPMSLSTRGMALGLTDSASYDSQVISIQPGDTVMVFTDGIPEAMNKAMEQFGEGRIQKLLSDHGKKSASALLEDLFHAVTLHVNSGMQKDDMTALLVKRLK